MIFMDILTGMKLIGKLLKNPHEYIDFGCGNLTMGNKNALSRASFVMTRNGTKCA
jgi:hypothetical protein